MKELLLLEKRLKQPGEFILESRWGKKGRRAVCLIINSMELVNREQLVVAQ